MTTETLLLLPRYFGGTLVLVAGACLIVFRAGFVRGCAEFQRDVFGYALSEADERNSRWFCIPFGLAVITVGVRLLLGFE